MVIPNAWSSAYWPHLGSSQSANADDIWLSKTRCPTVMAWTYERRGWSSG